MAYQALGLGSSANDGTGDDLRTGGDKINDNFVEIYTKLGNGSALSSLTFPTSTDTIVGRATTDTLTNKTLTAPTINGVVGGTATSQTITTLTTGGITGTGGALEITADNNIVEFRGDGTNGGVVGTIQLNCSANSHGQKIQAQPHSAGVTNTMLLPAGASSTLVSLVSADTLTNKTLTAPTIASITNGGTVTIPSGADTLVARTSTDTLTNKTLTNPTINAATFSGILGGAIIGGVNAASGAGSSVALSVTTLISEITTTGAQAFSLANGTAGQVKIITMVVDGGDATLTPATLSGGTTIVFNDAGDSVILVYHNTLGWKAIMNNGTTIS